MRAALLLAAASACYSPDPPRGLPCSPSGDCPSGQRCVLGTCGGVDVDAGLEAAPPPPDLGAKFGMPMVVGGQKLLGDQYGPTLTGDGALMFTSGQDLFGAIDIYSSTANSTGGFTIPSVVSTLSDLADSSDPEISLDGSIIVFSSQQAPAGIWYALHTAQGFMSIDSVLPGKRGPGLAAADGRLFCNDSTTQVFEEYESSPQGTNMLRTHPTLMTYQYPSGSYDGLEVFTMHAHQIYRSTRATLDDEFSEPTRVHFDAHDMDDKDDPEISQDGTTLYFSMRATDSIGFDTYMARR